MLDHFAQLRAKVESGVRLTSHATADRVPVTRKRARGARRPRVYLHVGEPKTGTTFLQHVMWGNRDQLAARGLLLPGYTRRDHSRASRDLRETLRPACDPADTWVGEWDVLAGQALCAREAAVVSDEVLAACTPEQAERAVRSLQPAQVHVVLTVRDFATLLAAEWQEEVKCRGTVPWESWLAEVRDAEPTADRRDVSWFWKIHDTLAILEMWSRHIPPDQVHVVIMPRQGQSEELWARFAEVLGIDPGGIDLDGARSNPSLGTVEAEFLRRMNEALPAGVPDWFYTRNIKRILAHGILSARPGQTRLVLPPAWRRGPPGSRRRSPWACSTARTRSPATWTTWSRAPRPRSTSGPPTSRPRRCWRPPFTPWRAWRTRITGRSSRPGRSGSGRARSRRSTG